MGITRRGDDINKLITRFEKNLKIEVEKEGKKLADLFYKTLIKNIETNKFGLPISSSTLSRRLRHGMGTKPLIETGEYIRAIILEGATVTTKEGRHNKGLTYAELSEILEFGRRDRSVPAFPVWRKTFEQLRDDLNESIDNVIRRAYDAK